MNWKQIKRIMICIACFYWVLAAVIFLIGGDGFRLAPVKGESLAQSIVIGEMTDGTELTQTLTLDMDRLDSIDFLMATYARQNTGMLHLQILDDKDNVVADLSKDVSTMEDNSFTTFTLDQPIEGRKGETLTLSFFTEGCTAGNAVTLYGGNSVATAKVDVKKDIPEAKRYRLNRETGAGMLCMRPTGVNFLQFYYYYWPVIAAAFALMAIYSLHSYNAMKRGENSMFAALGIMMTKYRFLIKQLVSRDFKSKYKRSILGIAWSFLNPLLTMLVQYMVFSTLFKSSIPNFPVYLLTGAVFFSFFNEAVSLGMTSIVGNASLIKKVYMPKYIYPISRVLSSLVNFALALMPLLLVMIVTKTAFRPSLLLLIYDIICYLGFITGMVMLLSTVLVFFQDVLFLWNVVSMLWMYLTPIFYPESIIPESFITIYRMNPLYSYINFARTCIIDGVSPQPNAYLGCLLPTVIMLVIGVLVFRKQQNKFIMYI